MTFYLSTNLLAVPTTVAIFNSTNVMGDAMRVTITVTVTATVIATHVFCSL